MADLVPNLRDLHGVAIDGGSVAPGRLLRSAAPAVGDAAPIGVVWPPVSVIDLRSASEIEPEHPLADGATIHRVPLLGALRPGAARPVDLPGLYLGVVESAGPMLVDVVRAISSAPGPALVHCAAGKDRTGISVALTLMLAGADTVVVVDDYLETAKHRAAIDARLSATAGHDHRLTLPASFFETKPDAIGGVIEVWEGHTGGVRGWFGDAGGTDDDLERLLGHLRGDTMSA
ncbi:tyrosine-protein phosphatase [Aeromicrobium sp. Leaf350]|uniref:tyrosine-protein phosphatase n=1 Tax=Aeromicrobium sp. Leaf350 TaxID=2876565 RepID=UPI001E645344|nr:tyrosine-protein phosphatase [Aeromicrobium sp. Leaf350]